LQSGRVKNRKPDSCASRCAIQTPLMQAPRKSQTVLSAVTMLEQWRY